MNPCANRRFFKSETDIKTGGIGGGFTDARTVRPRCRATAVLPGDCGSRYRVVATKKDAALPALGIVCNRRSDAIRHPSYDRCRPSGVVVRSRGLVASHPALHRGWTRLVARDLVMKAEVYRDNAGFWMARIEEDASTPENRGIGRVYRRQMLPVAPSVSKAEAEAALRRVMSREARCPHGHR